MKNLRSRKPLRLLAVLEPPNEARREQLETNIKDAEALRREVSEILETEEDDVLGGQESYVMRSICFFVNKLAEAEILRIRQYISMLDGALGKDKFANLQEEYFKNYSELLDLIDDLLFPNLDDPKIRRVCQLLVDRYSNCGSKIRLFSIASDETNGKYQLAQFASGEFNNEFESNAIGDILYKYICRYYPEGFCVKAVDMNLCSSNSIRVDAKGFLSWVPCIIDQIDLNSGNDVLGFYIVVNPTTKTCEWLVAAA